MKGSRVLVLPVLILSLGLLASCATAPVTDRPQLALVPAAELAEQSERSYDELLAESVVVQGTPEAEMVTRVGRRVAAAAEGFMRDRGMESELSLFSWEFNLIRDDEMVNAFCMPGGKIAVYTGILPLTQDETGLAVIMGHEVAHAIAQHGQERMSQALLVQLGASTLAAATSEQPEATQDLFLAAYGAGAQVGILLPYSRAHEHEADTIGLILTAKAGYDPRAAIDLWERMAAQGGERPPEFLSTHPHPENRIEELEEEMPRALEYYEGT
jgi:predicted Zn-dependent protease